MALEKTTRRMTLREMLIHSEKSARDIADRMQVNFLAHLTEFRKLNRPIRQKSQYPTFVAVHNSMKKLNASAAEMEEMVQQLLEMLQEISRLAQRERRRGLTS